MNRIHESYLVPFFKEMNVKFPDAWCVLHSYDTLPRYSESDVDMAFSGINVALLEALIIDIAKTTGWEVYQKLWYDVETCFYYVLKQNNTDIFLALDFLIDNDGIGRYGFKTKVLTSECIMTSNNFPIPNPEVAFSYKLIKRIVKKRSLVADKAYLMQHYKISNSEKIDLFLTEQFGRPGNERIKRFLTVKEDVLSYEEIADLNKKRLNRTSSYKNKLQYLLWQIRRVSNRILYPSGMIIYIPELKIEQMELLRVVLEDKLDILFRYIRLNPTDSIGVNYTSLVGSTLVICPAKRGNNKKFIKHAWLSKQNYFLELDSLNDSGKDVTVIADTFTSAILGVLKMRIRNRIVLKGNEQRTP